LSDFGTLKDGDGEDYSESWAWAYIARVGAAWVVQEVTTHRFYIPPSTPTDTEVIDALSGTTAERRALKALGE
jgi:hypothetical protein